MLELWHEWNSVHSFKVRVVLAEKDLQWTSHRVELLKFEHLRPEYLRLNPNGVVPTLRHDGRVVLESSVICQYLDETFPQPPLLPPEPDGRARPRAWLKYFDDVLHPALRAASFELLYRPLLAALPRAELERRAAAHPVPARARAGVPRARAAEARRSRRRLRGRDREDRARAQRGMADRAGIRACRCGARAFRRASRASRLRAALGAARRGALLERAPARATVGARGARSRRIPFRRAKNRGMTATVSAAPSPSSG
jgi:glutathione S-transferase